MGPRNTRRVIWIGAGLVAVVLVVTVVWLTRQDRRPAESASKTPAASSSGQATSSEDGHVAHTFYERGHVVGKLVFGMTEQQVSNRIGRPVNVIRWQGMPCWEYTVNEHVPASASGPGYTMNATAACFLAGRYSVPRYKINGKWGYNLITKQVTD